MKMMKRIASLLLAMVMVIGMSLSAFAADTTGSITIEKADNVSVAGKKFKAYKILDLELVGTDVYVYTVPAGLEDFYATKFSLDKTAGDFDYEVTQKIAAMKDDANALFAFAAEALAAAKDAKITPATATGAADATSVEFTGLPLGYYVIEDTGTATPISALMLDSTNPDVKITIKADKPELEKKIDGDTDTDKSTSGLVDYNNAAIGDEVPYILSSKVPDMTGYEYYYYIVTDTLSKGLTFNDDVVISIGTKTLTKGTDYTVTYSTNDAGETTVKIIFNNFTQYNTEEYIGKAIVITYSAKVNKDAVIGEEGNPNKVNLTYSNNPNLDYNVWPPEPGDDIPVGITPDDVTYTYVTDIEIIKVDPSGNRLTGAVFTLEGEKTNIVVVETDTFVEDPNGEYWKLTDGSYTTTDPATEDMDKTKYESTTTKYALTTVTSEVKTKEAVTAKGTVGSDGVLRFTGLSAGTYTITEITAPDGYNLLDAPITVTIGWTAPTAPSTDCSWSYSWSTDEDNSTNSIKVVNQAGTELPSTGGMGTTMFYLIGGVLVVAAVVLLVTKKRMNA